MCMCACMCVCVCVRVCARVQGPWGIERAGTHTGRKRAGRGSTVLLGSKSSKGRARPPRDTPPHGDAACGEDMGRRLDRNGKPGCVCVNCLRLQVAEGEIGPFGSIKVPVIFTPVIPGAVYTKFKVVFKNQQCPTVSTQPGCQGPCHSHSPAWTASWWHRWPALRRARTCTCSHTRARTRSPCSPPLEAPCLVSK